MSLLLRPRSWSIAALLCGVSVLAHAQTVWQCWRDHALHVVCVLPEAATLPDAEARALQPGDQGIRPPILGGQLPPLVRAVQDTPEALRGQFIRIPLHSEPNDPRFVAELAQAVMCGGHADCLAVYSEQPTRQLPIAIAISDAIDPLRHIR